MKGTGLWTASLYFLVSFWKP